MGFLSAVGSGVLGGLGDMIGMKYQSDLQGHQADKSFSQNLGVEQMMFEANKKLQQENWEKQTAYNTQMWEKEKANALDMWNKQNVYNSPQAQMDRYKEAGLNPLLAYTQGNPGNATTINTPMISKAELGGATGRAPTRDTVQLRANDMGSKMVGNIAEYQRIQNAGIQNQIMLATRALMGYRNRIEKANADVAEHDAEIVKKSPYLSHDPVWTRTGGKIGEIMDWAINQIDWNKVEKGDKLEAIYKYGGSRYKE